MSLMKSTDNSVTNVGSVSPGALYGASLASLGVPATMPSVEAKRAAPKPAVDLDVQFDQYYTQQEMADYYLGVVEEHEDLSIYRMVEPSAGTGAFYKRLPAGRLGFDPYPKYPGIITADFLNVTLPTNRPVAIIGNPPFGKNSSMAVRFFNHAAPQSDLIAFILPRTFRKTSIMNRLNRDFHLVHEENVPAYAFLFRSEPYDVPAVFQIWKRKPGLRPLTPVETRHPDFEFTTKDRADFAIQRVGAQAGRVHHNFEMAPAAHYFIRGAVEHIMARLDFASVVGNVAGNPSLAKSEIVALYRQWTDSNRACC